MKRRTMEGLSSRVVSAPFEEDTANPGSAHTPSGNFQETKNARSSPTEHINQDNGVSERLYQIYGPQRSQLQSSKGKEKEVGGDHDQPGSPIEHVDDLKQRIERCYIAGDLSTARVLSTIDEALMTTESLNIPKERHVKQNPGGGSSEKLDNSYMIRLKHSDEFFSVGRIFSTIWRYSPEERYEDDDGYESEVMYGEKVYSRIRRFVVVRVANSWRRSVTCLPITPYDSRNDTELKNHAFIYSRRDPPVLVRGMESPPLLARPSRERGSTALMRFLLLVDYSVPYTIDCNVKVKDIGQLDSDSRDILRRYFAKICFGTHDEAPPVEISAISTQYCLSGVGAVVGGQSTSDPELELGANAPRNPREEESGDEILLPSLEQLVQAKRRPEGISHHADKGKGRRRGGHDFNDGNVTKGA